MKGSKEIGCCRKSYEHLKQKMEDDGNFSSDQVLCGDLVGRSSSNALNHTTRIEVAATLNTLSILTIEHPRSRTSFRSGRISEGSSLNFCITVSCGALICMWAFSKVSIRLVRLRSSVGALLVRRSYGIYLFIILRTPNVWLGLRPESKTLRPSSFLFRPSYFIEVKNWLCYIK